MFTCYENTNLLFIVYNHSLHQMGRLVEDIIFMMIFREMTWNTDELSSYNVASLYF